MMPRARLPESLAVLAVLCLPVFAIAQATSQDRGGTTAQMPEPVMEPVIDPAVDINRDGFYSYPELQIIFAGISTDRFTMMDTSGDGLLDVHEVREALLSGQWPATDS